MKLESSLLPLAASRSCARWPADIPPSSRRTWEDSVKGFSATWRVPPGAGYDALRIELTRRFLVIHVRRGSIHLSHGDVRVSVDAGQMVAVSSPEVLATIPDSPFGDSVFTLHLFRRIPGREDLKKFGPLGALLADAESGTQGLFTFDNAHGMHGWEGPGGGPAESELELLRRMFLCGIELTVRFVGTAREALG